MRAIAVAATALGLLGRGSRGIALDETNAASIKDAASTVSYGLMKYYTGNNTGDTPGNLPQPYYWWEAGALFGTIIDYWWLTGDSTYNDVTIQAMLNQAGDDGAFLPKNQTLTEGNDDQGFWALAAMSAAENVFPNPPSDQPQWLAMAQSVFNQYVSRWDDADCGGGLRWQIFTWNNGYNYKNSVANGCFFDLAARLARYTGNQTYADWATKIYAWEQEIGLITNNSHIYDGIQIYENSTCGTIDISEWSYNSGLFMHGAAVMYNITQDSLWKTRLDSIINQTQANFVTSGVVYERFCELQGVCNLNEVSFKGFLLRWMAGTTQMASYTASTLFPIIQNSATNAASICTGPVSTGFAGLPNTACGFRWTVKGKYDGLVGVGSQMDALSAIIYLLIPSHSPPKTANTGGNSKGNPAAGTDTGNTRRPGSLNPATDPTPGGRFGAAIVTIILIVSVIGGGVALVL